MKQKVQTILLKDRQKTVDIDFTLTRKMALTMRAINHNLRKSIMNTLVGRKMCVKRIYIRLRLEQSVASQHLSILRKAKIVCSERRGKFIFYSLNHQTLSLISEVCNMLDAV